MSEKQNLMAPHFLLAVTFGMTSPTMYYYTKVMSELFLDSQFPDTKNTFRGSTTMWDFWRVSDSLSWPNSVNIMAADALAPGVTRPSAAMLLIM